MILYYRYLQRKLKLYKDAGITDISLRSSYAELAREYDRITTDNLKETWN